MIGEIRATAFKEIGVRHVAHYAANDYIKELGLKADQLEEYKSFIPFDSFSDDPEECLKRPFRRDPRSFENTRFSNGLFAVLYTALDESTAEAEIIYWAKKESTSGHLIFPRYYGTVLFQFEGTVKDLRPHSGSLEFLVSDDYSKCRLVAQEAVLDELDALLTFSARNHNGTCMPVFSEKSVSEAVWLNDKVLKTNISGEIVLTI